MAAAAVGGVAGAAAMAGWPGLELPERGRRRLSHPGPEAVSSAHLHHSRVGEGEEESF